ncbi:MAG: HAD family hydrolase [Promethearchaeota archaeon]
MIHVITFDLWNTLFTNKFYSDERISYFIEFLNERKNISSMNKVKEAFNYAFHLPERELESNNFRHIYTEDRISKMLEFLKFDLSKADKNKIKQEFEEIMLKDPPTLKKDVKKTLKKLTPIYKIGLISNTGVTPGYVIRKVLEKYQILQYFQLTLFSDETGFYKPSPIMFKMTLEKLNCQAQNAIHIGDILETDIKGAKECKMLAIWFNDSFSSRSVDVRPDFEIQQISEIIEIIKRLN